MNKEIANISLEQLLIIERLSQRTYNICEYNDLQDLQKILQYFHENKNFLKLRNCGMKSNLELNSLCNKYTSYFTSENLFNNNFTEERNAIQIIDKLSITQKALLNNTISIKFSRLTVRSKGVLLNILDNTLTITSVWDNIFSCPNFKIENLRNIGAKSVAEIRNLLNEVLELLQIISDYENEEELSRELFNSFFQKQFFIDTQTLADNGVFYDHQGIPVFKTIHFLIEQNYIYTKEKKYIFNHLLGFRQNLKSQTLEYIGIGLGMTRERVRQIRNKLVETFNDDFSFVSNFSNESLKKYKLDIEANILTAQHEITENIAKHETVNFNHFFINHIFSIILKNSYSLIGNESIIIEKEKKNTHKWETTYLIRNRFCIIFDFEKLVNDVDIRLSDKIEADYKFHFQAYLLDFRKSDCLEFLDEISNIAEQILFNEFELIIDVEDNINFAKNRTKTILDYIYEVLKEANKPLNAHEIFDILNQRSPDISKSAEALRGSCQRDSQLIYFGRSSTYGLKIWEEKHENIKGGTMHDISEEFLLKFEEPKHIDDISDYVRNFRNNVTSKNLFYNLKSAEHRRFIFFKNGLVGLASITYNTNLFPSATKNYKDRNTWEENFEILENFIKKNEHLPYSTGNEEEINSYRFFNIQVRKLNELDDKKKERIENFMIKFNYQKSAKANNMNREKSYEELISFVHKNGRTPSVKKSNEQKLYGFFYRQRKLYLDSLLSKDYLTRFSEIMELIKK
jgi:hypothetical protein